MPIDIDAIIQAQIQKLDQDGKRANVSLPAEGQKPTGLTADDRSEADRQSLSNYSDWQSMQTADFNGRKWDLSNNRSDTNPFKTEEQPPLTPFVSREAQRENQEEVDLFHTLPTPWDNLTGEEVMEKVAANMKLQAAIGDPNSEGYKTYYDLINGLNQAQQEANENRNFFTALESDQAKPSSIEGANALKRDIEHYEKNGQFNIDAQKKAKELGIDAADFVKNQQLYAEITRKSEGLSFTDGIREIASQTSPYYKKYKNSGHIDFTSQEWNDIAKDVAFLSEIGEEGKAMDLIDEKMQERIYQNQGFGEKLKNSVVGLGLTTGGGMIIAGAGMFVGSIAPWLVKDEYNDDPNASGGANYVNKIFNNLITRYGNDVATWGTYVPEYIEKAKEIGLSDINIAEKPGAGFFDIRTTPFIGIQQQGFTVGACLLGAAEAKIGEALYRGIRRKAMQNAKKYAAKEAAKAVTKGTPMTSVEITRATIDRAKTVIGRINKAENATRLFAQGYLVGGSEGVMEGLGTWDQILRQETQKAQFEHTQRVLYEYNRRMASYTPIKSGDQGEVVYVDSEGNRVNPQDVLAQVQAEFDPMLEQTLAEINHEALKAGRKTTFMNSILNGAIYGTFHAAYTQPSVQRILKESRATGWLFGNGKKAKNKGKFTFEKNGSTIEVSPEEPGSFWKGAWRVVKEPGGEFLQESAQGVFNAFNAGWAANNINEFKKRQYDPEAYATIGETYAGAWGSAAASVGEYVASGEALRDGMYGMMGSILGIPALPKRTFKLDENGNKIPLKDANGELLLDKYDNVQFEKTLFRRGANRQGKRETWYQMAARIIPWRSGLTGAYREYRDEVQAKMDDAKRLQEWINDPKVRPLFDGVAGVVNYTMDMNKSAAEGDEFSTRNAAQGKLFSEAVLLNMMRGSAMYDATVKDLTTLANMTVSNEAGKQFLKDARSNIELKERFDNMSDEEVIKQVSENAKKTLDMADYIHKESEKIDKLIGDVDSDTKQTIIYGHMAIDNWAERSGILDSEISKFLIKNPKVKVQAPGDPDKDKETIPRDISGTIENLKSEYGSRKGAEERKNNLEERKRQLEEQLANERKAYNLKTARLNKNDSKVKIKAYENSIKKVEKNLKKVDSFLKNASEDAVLTQEEIMALDPSLRAKMLSYSKLNKSKAEQNGKPKQKDIYSKEQQDIIDNIVEQGTSQDAEFLSKVLDRGRIEDSVNNYKKSYMDALVNRKAISAHAINMQAQRDTALREFRMGEINNIQDYEEFVASYEDFVEANPMSHNDIRSYLKKQGNKNFERYDKNLSLLSDMSTYIIRHAADKTSKFTQKDEARVVLASLYLSRKNIDMEDKDAVFEALTETDEQGRNKFMMFVDEQNQQQAEKDRLDLTEESFGSAAEIAAKFNEIVAGILQDREEAEKRQEKIPVEETGKAEVTTPESAKEEGAPAEPQAPMITAEDSVPLNTAETSEKPKTEPEPEPKSTPEAAPTEQEVADVQENYTTQEGGDNSFKFEEMTDSQFETEGTTTTVKDKDGKPVQVKGFKFKDDIFIKALLSLIHENYYQHSTGTIANTVMNALKEASLKYAFDSKDIRKAVEAVADVSHIIFEGDMKAQLIDALTKEMNKALGTGDASVAQILGSVIQSMEVADIQLSEETTQSTNIFNNVKTYQQFLNEDPDSGILSSVSIAYLRKERPDWATTKFLEKWGVGGYLNQGKLKSNVPIYFATSSELTQEVKASMGRRYTDANAPIIMIVEDENGTFTITGDDRKFQVVGIAPSTGISKSGSNKMEGIRKAANNVAGNHFVMAKNKKTDKVEPIKTKLYGKESGVRGIPATTNPRKEAPNNVQQVIADDVKRLGTEAEQAEWNAAKTKEEKRNTSIYKRLKEKLIKGLRNPGEDNANKQAATNRLFEYVMSSLVGGNRAATPFLRDVAMLATHVAFGDGNWTLQEALRQYAVDHDPSVITGFNTILQSLDTTIKEFANNLESIDADAEQEFIDRFCQAKGIELNALIGNYVRLSGSGLHFSLQERRDAEGNLITQDGKAMFDVVIKTDTAAVHTSEKVGELESPNITADLIAKSILDVTGTNERLMWQITPAKVDALNSDKATAEDKKDAEEHVNTLIDNGILEMNAYSLTYQAGWIDVQTGFVNEYELDQTPTPPKRSTQPQSPVANPTTTNNTNTTSTPSNPITNTSNVTGKEAAGSANMAEKLTEGKIEPKPAESPAESPTASTNDINGTLSEFGFEGPEDVAPTNEDEDVDKIIAKYVPSWGTIQEAMKNNPAMADKLALSDMDTEEGYNRAIEQVKNLIKKNPEKAKEFCNKMFFCLQQ